VVRVGDDEVIAGPPGCDIDAANDLGEEFAVEVRKENADSAGAAGDEASRAAVGDVTECRGDVANPAACLFPNQSTAVENAGDRSDRDVGFASDIFDRGNGSGGRGRSIFCATWMITIRNLSPREPM
jgi:hypothetical protein